MARIKDGDIFELKTSLGFVYLHRVLKDKTIGELMRVLPGFFKQRPSDFIDIVQGDEQFYLFFPLSAASKRKIISHVGFYPSNSFSKPKVMRVELFKNQVFSGWHIVNTDDWSRTIIKELSDDHKKLSPWGVWNDTLLVERLVDGWTLENWEEKTIAKTLESDEK